MSFSETLARLDFARCLARIDASKKHDVKRILASREKGFDAIIPLLSSAAKGLLEPLARHSQQLTQQRFGKVIRLFAPLYLSNECVNNCLYCGFSRDNAIYRTTLSVDEIRQEARALSAKGFRNLLLVAGEHPRFVSTDYLENCLQTLRGFVPSLSLEMAPMKIDEYRKMVSEGAEGLVIYQETYDRNVYSKMHTSGPKRNFDWRLETPERAYEAGFRRIGIGALLGLNDWKKEAIALAAHANYLLKHCWKSQLTIAFPRLRPCSGEFQPRQTLSDATLVQLVTAFRIAFPDVGLVLSTRESVRLRDGLIPLGITLMSAGSHTEPGGYTGTGKGNLHLTNRRGNDAFSKSTNKGATGQFEIADDRRPDEVANSIRRLGYEPVWKDWDATLVA